MEPKDLKKSNVELSDTILVSETVNDQNVTDETPEQPEMIEIDEIVKAIEGVEEVPVIESVDLETQEVEIENAPEVNATVSEPAEEEVVEETEVELDEVLVAEETQPVVDEITAQPKVEEVLSSEVIESATELDQEEVKKEIISDEIPSIEELIDVSEEDLEIHEDDILDENSPKLKMADYADLDETGLINALRILMQNTDFDRIRDDVDAIKINFFRRYRANIEAQKVAFTEAGGDITEFKAEPDPNELDLRNLLKQYQDIRNEHNKKMDESKESNLHKKYEIIEEIKALINNKESINKTFHDFRDLQNRWRDIGPVPQAKLKDLWDTYHHHVENFYDFIKINKELRDLDLKKNLETKIEICEKSEELLVEPSIIKAFNVLQKYHEQWREVGPVPRDKKDELWERFKNTTSIINKKHQDYFEVRKSDQKKNLDAKIALFEKVEQISIGKFENP